MGGCAAAVNSSQPSPASANAKQRRDQNQSFID